jgi:dTMP kinase
MNSSTLLVSFEGIDGCGKTTQVNLLLQKLQLLGKKAQMLREPGGTQASEKIRELLLQEDLALEPLSELLLFSAARAELVTKVLTPLLASNELDVVILDRFTDSTIAYQGYGSGIPNVTLLAALATDDLVPDLTFYLRLPPETAYERVSRRTDKKDRFESRPKSFFAKVQKGYDILAATPKNSNRIKVIDATQTPEAAAIQIFNQIQKHLKYEP